MKMQKYTAPDMRTALRKVRTDHGPDALILFTRRAAGVVELTVATDPEAAARVGALTPARQVVGGEPLSTVLDMPIPAPTVA
jgi:flagellar biosynthesis protein FlhF